MNLRYAEAICRNLVLRGQVAVFASHMFYPQFLDDENPNERKLGINLGIVHARCAQEVWFCTRQHEEMSTGMQYSFEVYKNLAKLKKIEMRRMFIRQSGEFIYEDPVT